MSVLFQDEPTQVKVTVNTEYGCCQEERQRNCTFGGTRRQEVLFPSETGNAIWAIILNTSITCATLQPRKARVIPGSVDIITLMTAQQPFLENSP